MQQCGTHPCVLLRRRESEYKELGLADESLTRDQVISAKIEHSKLIERPIAISGGKAVVSRPTEKVLEPI